MEFDDCSSLADKVYDSMQMVDVKNIVLNALIELYLNDGAAYTQDYDRIYAR